MNVLVRPETPPSPPEGFVDLTPPGVFLNRSAYYFWDGDGQETTRVGTWITQDQCNSENFAHGGFLLTFADFALTYCLKGITLNLSCDFIRGVPLGAWLEVSVSARRRSKRLLFADAIATSDGVDALRMSGIFRPLEKRSDEV